MLEIINDTYKLHKCPCCEHTVIYTREDKNKKIQTKQHRIHKSEYNGHISN